MNALKETLEYRKNKISSAIDILDRTQILFDKFGSQELKTTIGKFGSIKNSLESNQVKIVVIGEFSRGKSMLVNALLGLNLLRSATEATTAINTFIYCLPEGRKEPFIRVKFQDDREPQEFDLINETTLEKWGTELDKNNRDARREVELIEIYCSNSLLEKGLVIIDTPGLQSIVEHHEDITRKAIDESHIAIWVQSTEQLGGNKTEWNFLKNTIRKNFRKFLTVINKWDLVLEPQDEQDKQKPELIRVKEKLSKVKGNFEAELSNLNKEELNQLTSSENLFGISSLWALKKDDKEKYSRSGIEKLGERIANLITSGEAEEEIYFTPLKKIQTIQKSFLESVEDSIKQIKSDKTIQERKREIELLESEIKNLMNDEKQESLEAKEEHNRNAAELTKDIQNNLIDPLKELKNEIDLIVDRSYVKKLIDKNCNQIGLPEDLQKQFDAVLGEMSIKLEAEKKKIIDTLSDLRTNYESVMQKHIGKLNKSIHGIDIEIPPIEINLDIDLAGIEEYYIKKTDLEKKIQDSEEEIETLQQETLKYIGSEAKVKSAKESLDRVQRQIESLGGQPAPLQKTSYSEGGWYSSPKPYSYYDSSNVQEWKEQREKLDEIMENKENALAKILEEEEKKTGIRISKEAAMRKLEDKINKMRKQYEIEEKKAEEERENLINEVLSKLIKNTSGEIEKRIKFLEKNLAEVLQKLFDDQLELLVDCVKEQFIEPLKAKQNQREEIKELFEKGESEVRIRTSELENAKSELQKLILETEDKLKS